MPVAQRDPVAKRIAALRREIEKHNRLYYDEAAPEITDAEYDALVRELAELELIGEIGEVKDVAVGLIDVKSYYLETPEDVEERIRACLAYVPPERLAVAPDCGLSQTARWAARAKLESLVEGARRVRAGL